MVYKIVFIKTAKLHWNETHCGRKGEEDVDKNFVYKNFVYKQLVYKQTICKQTVTADILYYSAYGINGSILIGSQT